MGSMRSLFLALLLVLSVSCGDDERLPPADARPGPDVPVTPQPDADPNAPDATPGAPDATPGTPDATPAAPDAASGGVGVACGGAICTAGQSCCIDNSGPMGTAECVGPGMACAADEYQCDGPEDCGGNNCCGDTMGGSTCAGGPAACPELTLCTDDGDCGLGELCCPPGGPVGLDSYNRCTVTVVCPL